MQDHLVILSPISLSTLNPFETSASSYEVLSNDSSVEIFSRNLSSYNHRIPNEAKKNNNNSKQTLIDLITSKVSCELTANDKKAWPDCAGKMAWMEKMWKQDSCYLGKSDLRIGQRDDHL